MKLTGKIMAAASAVVYAASLALLPYIGGGGPTQTLWDLTTRWPVIITILALAVLVLSLVSIFVSRLVLVALATSVSFYLFGQTFDTSLVSYAHLGSGFWVSSVASLTMAVASLAVLLGSHFERAPVVPGFSRSVALPNAAGAPGPSSAPPASVPAAWYEDPSGQAGQRYWSGVAWTDQVRT